MNKVISIAALIAGVVLIVFGINASNSAGSHISNFFTGAPTNKSIWLLIVGIVLAVAGLATAFRRSKEM